MDIYISCEKDAEMDEMWSYVQNKKQQRWLFHAIEKKFNNVLAYEIGPRTKNTLRKLLEKLKVFNIADYYTDAWKAYNDLIPSSKHFIGKRHTQSIERKHLNFRTRIKRLCRKTICFSKSTDMHDILLGLFINKYEFCRDI